MLTLAVVVALFFMAPKRKRSYADELPELARLPRKELLLLIKRLKDGSCD